MLLLLLLLLLLLFLLLLLSILLLSLRPSCIYLLCTLCNAHNYYDLLSLPLSLFLSLCSSLSLSLCSSLPLSLRSSLSSSLSLFLSHSLFLSLYISLYLSLSLFQMPRCSQLTISIHLLKLQQYSGILFFCVSDTLRKPGKGKKETFNSLG